MIINDTICAIATSPGGAIGVIRVSGADAITITERIFTPFKELPLRERKAYVQTFGHIHNPDTKEIIDEVLVTVFRAPHSYTGEDSTEISCHGSQYILQQVLQLLITGGARMAHAGEYTQRAFLNGKMDLSQAEAVADLIASRDAATHRLAMTQMRGGFSHELATLREQLLRFTSMVELELDFSEEDVEFADRQELRVLADHIEKVISRLADSFRVGNALKNGLPVAIIGEPNVGKSTLLNCLLNEERAIVSDISGTTRDIIEDTVNMGGYTFRFIDTAGIRETDDTIERLGIERSYRALDEAQILLLVVDERIVNNTSSSDEWLQELSYRSQDKQVVVVVNKSDLLPASVIQSKEIEKRLHDILRTDFSTVYLSARKNSGVDTLCQLLIKLASQNTINESDIIVTNLRHYEALTLALASIRRVQAGLQTQLSGDFLSQDIRECIFHLSDIVGEVTNDEVLGSIFKNFCIGK